MIISFEPFSEISFVTSHSPIWLVFSKEIKLRIITKKAIYLINYEITSFWLFNKFKLNKSAILFLIKVEAKVFSFSKLRLVTFLVSVFSSIKNEDFNDIFSLN